MNGNTMQEIKDDITKQEEIIRKLLEEIYDPEIPVISITDLGIVRVIKVTSEGINTKGVITITPTYSGCPAMDVIAMQIRMSLLQNGYNNIEVKKQLSPAWTTDWMTEKGKEQLKAYGIAPPAGKLRDVNETVQCPHCNSYNTILLSQFGSTACKALYKCNDCLEPFDYFKCH